MKTQSTGHRETSSEKQTDSKGNKIKSKEAYQRIIMYSYISRRNSKTIIKLNKELISRKLSKTLRNRRKKIESYSNILASEVEFLQTHEHC